MLLTAITTHLNILQHRLKINVYKTTKHGSQFMALQTIPSPSSLKEKKRKTRSIDPQQTLQLIRWNTTPRANIFEVTSFSGG